MITLPNPCSHVTKPVSTEAALREMGEPAMQGSRPNLEAPGRRPEEHEAPSESEREESQTIEILQRTSSRTYQRFRRVQ